MPFNLNDNLNSLARKIEIGIEAKSDVLDARLKEFINSALASGLSEEQIYLILIEK